MLRLEKINKSYTTGNFTQQALKDVSLEFRKNEFVAILGPSGSGKTTLLNIIGGLDRYDSGDLIINDKSTKKFKSHEWDAYRNNCIGFVFQNYNLISHLSILENVQMGMTLSGVSARKRKQKAMELLTKVGLKEHSHKRPNQLSGGQMQRVAIARALANNPDVILADEPTGALDSKTSVQIMELIQEIANDKLVIMVTHNSELAEKYATRIVSFKDGELISDTMPIKQNEKAGEPYKLRKTAMSFITALKLSFNNIRTKKGRTLLTSFASSIGIIGIALILSLSNGFDKQIDKFEHDTLSNFPIMITKTALDLSEEAMQNVQNDAAKTDKSYTKEKFVYPYEAPMNVLRHENKITSEYINYVNKIDKSWLSGIGYTRIAALNILTQNSKGKIVLATANNKNNNNNNNMFNINQTFTPLPKKINDNSGFIENNYDVLVGKLPTEKNEIIIQIDSKNRLREDIVDLLGIDPDNVEIAFETLIGKEFKLIFNDNFYKKVGNFYTLNTDFNSMYDSGDSFTLKVVGIIRGKEGNQLTAEGNGIAYSEELMDYIIEKNSNSKIGKDQIASNYNVLTGQKFELITEEGIEAKESLIAYLGASNVPYAISIYPKDFSAKEKITSYLDTYNNNIAKKVEPSIQEYLSDITKKITVTNDPLLTKPNTSITGGSEIKEISLEYKKSELNGNIKTKECEFKVEKSKITKSNCGITYTDYAAAMVSLSGNIMDAVTIVLIAFSAISLIVSSIMIGIITYISVLERTKEIGILRALGARKKDISRVFNAETFIIGTSSGLIGIGIALLLTIPANIIIYDLTDLKDVAQLNPMHALILIIVSVTLTLIGGIIPAKIASRKDPVESLRTE